MCTTNNNNGDGFNDMNHLNAAVSHRNSKPELEGAGGWKMSPAPGRGRPRARGGREEEATGKKVKNKIAGGRASAKPVTKKIAPNQMEIDQGRSPSFSCCEEARCLQNGGENDQGLGGVERSGSQDRGC